MRIGEGRPSASCRALRRFVTRAIVAAALLAGAGVEPAPAQALRTRVTLRPGTVKLGERVVVRGQVIGRAAPSVAWMRPEAAPSFTWGVPRSEVRPAKGPGGASRSRPDTAWVEVSLQVFETGMVPVPGMRFQYRTSSGAQAFGRLPVANLVVISQIAPADTQARLRDVRHLAAPWWERVPWRWVALGTLLLGVAAWIGWWLRRRRPAAPLEIPAAEPGAAERALAALAALRAQDLPGRERYAEHAFELGQILRRYLEATVATTRPGDSTPELLAHLRDAGLEADDLQRLAGLLRVWDRVKFAREPFTRGEALRTEAAVEAFVRRPAPGARAEVA
jgi:hypothetical protein